MFFWTEPRFRLFRPFHCKNSTFDQIKKEFHFEKFFCVIGFDRFSFFRRRSLTV